MFGVVSRACTRKVLFYFSDLQNKVKASQDELAYLEKILEALKPLTEKPNTLTSDRRDMFREEDLENG